MQDGMRQRLYVKSLGNQVAIAVGSSSSKRDYSMPALAEAIVGTFKIDFPVEHPLGFFQAWNDLIKEARKKVSKEDLLKFVRDKIRNPEPEVIHKKIAAIPISNFIDTTFDRSFHRALLAAGRKPILHDWKTQAIGSWRQSNPENPNLFFMLDNLEDPNQMLGLYEPTSWWKQNRIQIENMREMLSEKDLLLTDFSAHEAESVFHLSNLTLSCEKVVNYTLQDVDAEYWLRMGAYLNNASAEAVIDHLQSSGGGRYSSWDMLIPRRKLIDVSREKLHDCFISYFSGDKGFVGRLERDLRLREIHIWKDDSEIEIGDSISDRIQQGLADSYCFIIVLSAEALSRPWVKEELRAAYALRLGGEFRILPVLHKECDIPPFLMDYKFADFREDRRYDEQLALLERAVKNAVKRAREKK
jgi:hypothetical protein